MDGYSKYHNFSGLRKRDLGSQSLELAGTGADKGNEGAKAEATSDPLREQAAAALSTPEGRNNTDRTRVTDQAQTPQSSDEPDDPYTHTNKIRTLSAELDQLTAEDKKPTDVITVDGKQVTVRDRVTEVKNTIKAEIELAKTAAKAINQETVAAMINQNAGDKNTLARQLGLDPTKVTPELLQQERQRAANDPSRRATIDQLDLNLQERAAMEALRHAPAYVKVVEAEVTAKGYGNTRVGLGEEVSAEEQRKAFDLLKLAGNEDPDLKATEIYAKAEMAVSLTFATYQEQRSQQIIDLMTKATEAGRTGEKQTVVIDGQTKQLSQEDLLKEANRLADKINVGWVASQAVLPRNMESGLSEPLLNIVYVASHARLDYVNFMAKNGQIAEAQTLYNRVKTDTPELIYNKDGSYRDASLQTLDVKLTLGVNTDGVDYQTAQSNFLANIEKGNIHLDRSKPGQSAQENLDQMKALNREMKRDMQEANRVLRTDREDLVKRQQEMEQKTTRTELEQIELDRVKREIKVIDNTIKQREEHLKRRENLTTYMEGCWLEAKEDYSAANARFKEFNRNEGDETLKKQLDTDGKIGRTEGGFSGWWNRNWKYVAVGAAVVAAAAVTVGTLGAGSALGVGIVATSLAAVGLGTAGAAGAHWAIERTVNEDAGLESAWTGAKIGLATSSMIVAPWATSGLRAASAAGAVTEATAVTAGGTASAINTANTVAQTSRIAQAAQTLNKFGINRYSLASGYSVQGAIEGGDYLMGNKTGLQAVTDLSYKGLFQSVFIGQAAKWGMPAAEATVAANAARATIPSALGLTTQNAAIGYTVSGIMEGYNYFNDQKSGGEALRDFAIGGTANTLTLSVLRKYGFSDAVGKAATPALQNISYAGQAIAFRETFGVAADIVATRYVAHDLMGQPAFVRESPMHDIYSSFTSPLAASLYNSAFGSGLNPRHAGERRRFASNLDFLGNDLNATILVDQKFVNPFQINKQGMVYNLDPDEKSQF